MSTDKQTLNARNRRIGKRFNIAKFHCFSERVFSVSQNQFLKTHFLCFPKKEKTGRFFCPIFSLIPLQRNSTLLIFLVKQLCDLVNDMSRVIAVTATALIKTTFHPLENVGCGDVDEIRITKTVCRNFCINRSASAMIGQIKLIFSSTKTASE